MLVDPAIQTDDDVLMLAAAQAARTAHLLTTLPITDHSLVSARWGARDIAAGLFLGTGVDDPSANISIVATTLAGAHATRLSETLSHLVRARADHTAGDVLGDAYHLCRHLHVRVAAEDPTQGAAAQASLRVYLLEHLGKRAVPPPRGEASPLS
jgi:hypothetical protein